MPARVKKGDRVMCVAGKDKGRTGTVLDVMPADGRVLVEGINIVKRHTKARPPDDPGGIIEKPAPIHLSNVMPIDPSDDKPCLVRIEEKGGERIRVSARTGEALD